MRIRTVKPDLYRHRELFDLEQETQLPIRLAWSGLPGVCDREGRFEWKPEVIKLDVLPFDKLDFSWVLDALAARDFITKYRKKAPQDQSTETHVHARAEKCFGLIPSFAIHQRPNQREAKSILPALDAKCERIDVPFPTIPDRTFLHVQDHGEGKGREGEREQEGEGEQDKYIARTTKKKALCDSREIAEEAGKGGIRLDGASPTALAWRAYEDAFEKRYGSKPPGNRTSMGQLSQFVQRIPRESAPAVAAFYLTHNDAFYVRTMHPVGMLLKNAEKLYTEWQTGQRVTATSARQADKFGHAEEQIRRIREGTL